MIPSTSLLGAPSVADAQTLEREYSPSSCIGGDYQPALRAYAERSTLARAAAQAAGGRWLEGRYGGAPAQRIDLCLPAAASGADAPLLVFIHGGYWQELSAADSLFAAAACIERGVGFAALDYTLAPRASVGGIVAECRAALDWLLGHATQFAIDRERAVIAGSSAGAHLAAMLVRELPLHAAVLVSGVYWLEPLVPTSINDALALDATTARSLSPGLLPLLGFARSVVCWGEIETASFKAQSRAFAAALAEAGVDCRCFEIPARNHFDVVLDLAEPGTALGDATWALLNGA